jgi:protein subunit release factor A
MKKLNKKVFLIRWKRGQGPGGQHRNKTENCCVLTHLATGVTVTYDGRSRKESQRKAMELMEEALKKRREDQEKEKSKKRRDEKIKGEERIRTYDYSRGVVTDHRTGKTASIKDIILKGLLDKLR